MRVSSLPLKRALEKPMRSQSLLSTSPSGSPLNTSSSTDLDHSSVADLLEELL